MVVGKHIALAAELEKNILAGAYGWEGGLPSAGDLAQRWHMSINTVKNALALLEGKGLVEKRGQNYYVSRIPTVMTQYVPPAHIRRQQGFCKNIGSVKRMQLPAQLAAKLSIPQMDAVYRVQVAGEVTEGNERPLQLIYRYYTLPLPDDKVTRMDGDNTYDPMWNDSETATELMSHDEVTPHTATEGERDLLNLPEAAPVSHVLETIHNKDGKLLMVTEIVLSPRTTLIFDYPFTNRPAEP